MASPLLVIASAEIVGLHDFFVLWFSGQPASFEHCKSALHPDFTMISPDGSFHVRKSVLDRIEAAHGSARIGFRIEISDITPVWQTDEAIAISYVESQWRQHDQTQRRSTALFINDASTSNIVVWRHLHETWV